MYAGETPALPGSLPPVTWLQPRRFIGLSVYMVVRLQQPSAVSSSNDLQGMTGADLQEMFPRQAHGSMVTTV